MAALGSIPTMAVGRRVGVCVSAFRRPVIGKPARRFVLLAAASDSQSATVAAVAATPNPTPRRHSLLPLISSAVAIQAQTQRFEELAGRSAMIGVLVALVAELLTERSIFKHFSPDIVVVLGSLFLGAVSLAAAAACASKRRLGVELLEAVVTSLTANQRSAASVTGRQVDTAVDSVLNSAFDTGVICSILADHDDI